MLGFLGGAALGAFGYKGAKEQNVASAQQAQAQMDFQREMSNTAVQRRMADLKKAGINPILAGSKEASSPAGAMAPQFNKAQVALQNATSAANIRNIDSQTALNMANLPKQTFWSDVFTGIRNMGKKTSEGIQSISPSPHSDMPSIVNGSDQTFKITPSNAREAALAMKELLNPTNVLTDEEARRWATKNYGYNRIELNRKHSRQRIPRRNKAKRIPSWLYKIQQYNSIYPRGN